MSQLPRRCLALIGAPYTLLPCVSAICGISPTTQMEVHFGFVSGSLWAGIVPLQDDEPSPLAVRLVKRRCHFYPLEHANTAIPRSLAPKSLWFIKCRVTRQCVLRIEG